MNDENLQRNEILRPLAIPTRPQETTRPSTISTASQDMLVVNTNLKKLNLRNNNHF